jgi:hypothetical protein
MDSVAVQKVALLKAYGALEWCMGAMEALDARRMDTERPLELSFLAETLDEVRTALRDNI